MKTTRRNFVKTSSKAALATGIGISFLPAVSKAAKSGFYFNSDISTPYTQTPLPYGYADLKPTIDAQTMEIHYTKHAASYAKNLAEATAAENVDTSKISLETLLSKISGYSEKMRNNAGGHYNHEMFWKIMTPNGSAPLGKIADAITKDFNSPEAFKNQFNEAAKTRFGSGWAWLIVTSDKKLAIGSTPNQDNPLMDLSTLKGYPLMGIDVWEHAYYLKYQNKRPDYIAAWWNVINWPHVEERFMSMV